MRRLKDPYFLKAKAENFPARSVYKLEEIDGRKKLFKKGQKILDLGCAPGSWSSYVSVKVGASGGVFGVDVQETSLKLPNFRFALCPVERFAAADFPDAPEKFDAVISDMAPKTTGIKSLDSENSKNLCLSALDVAERCLGESGFLLVKIFQGASFQEYLNTFSQRFHKFDILKPKAVRRESKEIYLLGTRLKPKK